MAKQTYKIVSFLAENIKRLQVVEITPSGALVEIAGKNRQGKTSVLDSIWWAIEGTRNIQAEPIRKGADKARIRLDLGELIVTRTFAAKEEGGFTTTVSVTSADGAKFDKPQTILDSLVGQLSFDPLAFTRMGPADQFDALKQFVPNFDFLAMARKQKAAYDERTDVNREAKARRARAAAISLPDGVPTERVDETALVVALEEAGRENADLERRKTAREGAQARLADMEAEIAALQKERDELAERIANSQALPEPKDTAALMAAIEEARKTNAVVDAVLVRAAIVTAAEELEAKSKELTESIEAIDTAKTQAIAAAKMPVAGLGFGDNAITLNGEPFDQASDAEQLEASIAIAAAMNPDLRVIRVRDGSLLDEDAMVLLAKFAEENDMQVWVERVAATSAMGFVLENGLVASGPTAKPPAPEATSADDEVI